MALEQLKRQKMALKNSQDGPKSLPYPKMASKTALEHPKGARSRPREAPKTTSEGVRRARKPPRGPREVSKTAQ
eukprot:8335269-Pyramimonas_sp.AAC.1